MFRAVLSFTCFWIISLNALCQDLVEEFQGNRINRSKWKTADLKWGEYGCDRSHGGVIPEHVFLQDGNLVIRANGDRYEGKLKGHGQKHRVGGALLSKKRYASGRYEIRAKICPQKGVLSAFWTYYHLHDSVNHEIDFEFPGKIGHPGTRSNSPLDWGILTNWRGTSPKEHRSVNKYFGDQTDGNYHLYRFDWHTGSATERPRVEWYYDNKLIHTSYEAVPTRAARLWLGLWFPCWIGPADFESDFMYIDWVKISSFNEPGDIFRRRKD